MSKSLKRVRAALDAAGAPYDLREMAVETRTAQQAADAAGCALDQIAKSIILAGEDTGTFFLFLTAGGNAVDKAAAAALVKEPTRVPGGTEVRAVTGFAIGGVSPVGHMTPIRAFADPRLLDFPLVWAAAGTPRHIFGIDPADLLTIANATQADFLQKKSEAD